MSELREATERVRRATTKARALPLATAMTHNALRAEGKRVATRLRNVLSLPVVLAGAGPSLARNVRTLKAHRHRVHVVAVNTAVPALLAAGVVPDLVVVLEVCDVRKHLDGYTGPVACTLSGHPEIFDRADVLFAPVSQGHSGMYQAGRLVPVSYGGSAMTAALALLNLWRAPKVALVGQDLGYTFHEGEEYADGYAPSSGWDGVRVRLDREAKRLHFEGRPDRAKAHHDAGVPAMGNVHNATRLPALREGEEVWAKWDMATQRAWFSELPESVRARLTNCTEGGATIDGVSNTSLRSWLMGCHKRAPTALSLRGGKLSAREVEAMRAYLVRDAEVGRGASELGSGAVIVPSYAMLGCGGVTEAFAASDWLRNVDQGAPMNVSARNHYVILREASRRLLATIEGATK